MTSYQGQHVLYRLSQNDVDWINQRRFYGGATGNPVTAGDVCPAFIVRKWSESAANLTVFLDGRDTHWATSVSQGDGDGQWSTLPVAAPESTPDAAS